MFLILCELVAHFCVAMSSKKIDNAIVTRQPLGLQMCAKLSSAYGECRSHTFHPVQLTCTLEIMAIEHRSCHDVNVTTEVCATSTRYSRTIHPRQKGLRKVIQTLKVSRNKKAIKKSVARNKKIDKTSAARNRNVDEKSSAKNKKAEEKSWSRNKKADEKAEVSRQPGHCSAPVHLRNANVTPGEQQEGSVKTYTCNHGYLDTSLDSTTAVTTCMTDGEWSKVNLNCSGPYIRMEIRSQQQEIFTRIPLKTLDDITGNTSTLIFLIRTCRDLKFRLSERSNYDSTMDKYLILIGGWYNTDSAIFKYNNCDISKSSLSGSHKCTRHDQSRHKERGIVSCKEFRPFWLSWKKGNISVGKGHIPGDQVFMEGMAPGLSPVINVSISSHKRNPGTWLFVPQRI